jgi:hypothetical protein
MTYSIAKQYNQNAHNGGATLQIKNNNPQTKNNTQIESNNTQSKVNSLVNLTN